MTNVVAGMLRELAVQSFIPDRGRKISVSSLFCLRMLQVIPVTGEVLVGAMNVIVLNVIVLLRSLCYLVSFSLLFILILGYVLPLSH